MNVENPHTLGGRVVTNDTSAACLIEAEKIAFGGWSLSLSVARVSLSFALAAASASYVDESVDY